MNPNDLAVATYDTHLKAEHAVIALQRAGFDMRRISIIGRDYSTEEQVVGFFNAGDRARFFGKYGAFWSGLFGMLFGAAFLFAPVVGHIVVFGPLASTIVGGLEGAAVGSGVSALLGALSALGVPKNSVLRYATAILADRFLLVVHGDSNEIQRARDVLAATDVNRIDHHPAGGQTTVEVHA
jgi:heat induced stress protein YflT